MVGRSGLDYDIDHQNPSYTPQNTIKARFDTIGDISPFPEILSRRSSCAAQYAGPEQRFDIHLRKRGGEVLQI